MPRLRQLPVRTGTLCGAVPGLEHVEPLLVQLLGQPVHFLKADLHKAR